MVVVGASVVDGVAVVVGTTWVLVEAVDEVSVTSVELDSSLLEQAASDNATAATSTLPHRAIAES